MIKNIFLHIGVHKTASTTIQNTLFIELSKLAEAGILYPEFKAGDIPIANHSIPFYSLFCKEPEKYHINVSHGFTTNEAIQQLHHNYCQQIKDQIAGFHGETLIISGEDISRFDSDELRNLKAWLRKITYVAVNIQVVLLCRHPISRFRSALQASVCDFGIPLEKSIARNLGHKHFYRNLITAFSEVFGPESISVLKYEDAVSQPFGPAGSFLALVDKGLPDKIKPALLHDNPARKYETFLLLNAINQTCYHTSGQELQPQRMVGLNEIFSAIPGQKFMLPKGLSKKAWEVLAEDVNWLCREFSLPEYQFIDEDLKADADIWNKQTLIYLRNMLPRLSPEYRKTILHALLHNLIGRKHQIPCRKRINLMILILTQLKTSL